MEKFTVGQIIFLFLRQEHQVVPAQIVEEVVHRKLNTQETKYFVRLSTDAKSKSFQLDVDKEKVFVSLNDAREFMMNNARKAIDEICDDTMAAMKQFETVVQTRERSLEQEKEESPVEMIPTYVDSSVQKIRLPNGEIVNVRSN